ncbi:MAG: NUDIX domain-containing protein [Candidatus Protochlamydia sp.]|nr:NUDIX domain-containing protein [Candidatus Protochlamydia sp.]
MVKHEYSFGIIPLRQKKNKWEMLLVQHQAGHWAFPKGHPEKGETSYESAERELFEETGLKVESYLMEGGFKEHYFFMFNRQRISKTVEYFPAIVLGEVKIQEEELKDFKWLDVTEAEKFITFKEGKKMCAQVSNLLK